MPSTINTNTPTIKQFLREIGARGGKASAKHPDRKRLNKKAAETRWRSTMPKPKEIPK